MATGTASLALVFGVHPKIARASFGEETASGSGTYRYLDYIHFSITSTIPAGASGVGNTKEEALAAAAKDLVTKLGGRLSAIEKHEHEADGEELLIGIIVKCNPGDSDLDGIGLDQDDAVYNTETHKWEVDIPVSATASGGGTDIEIFYDYQD